MGKVSRVALDMEKILAAFRRRAPIDTGEKGDLGYGGFPRKTAIFAARAGSAVLTITRVK